MSKRQIFTTRRTWMKKTPVWNGWNFHFRNFMSVQEAAFRKDFAKCERATTFVSPFGLRPGHQGKICSLLCFSFLLFQGKTAEDTQVCHQW